MSEKKIRITKSQRFEDIIALLNGEPVKYGTDIDTAVGVINHELELIANKNKSGGEKKLTEKQKQNEEFKGIILEYMANKPDGVTCTELVKQFPKMESSQRVSALMRQLKLQMKIEGIEGKNGRTLFKLM